MSDWQPIETAPKDGTDIIVYDPHRGVDMARWADLFLASRVNGEEVREYGFVVRNTTTSQTNPTHWQPIPPKP